MNTQSNVLSESLESQAIPPVISPSQRVYWSMRRELWENRSIYIAPLSAVALVLFGFLISVLGLPHKMRSLPALDPEHQRRAILAPYEFAAGMIMVTTLIVGVFYALDALYGERRDRSILFWKSLPVSDLTTVLTKASIPILILPLLTVALIVATQFIMLVLSTVILMGAGLSAATLWSQVSFFQMSLLLFYHLGTVHILWHAPIYCWFLLVSGWARRATFLWAVLPPLAICFVEKIAFNTSHFASLLVRRMTGGPEAMPLPGRLPMDPGMHLTPGNFLVSPGLWLGLIVAAGLLAAAVRLRRYRGPI